MKLMEMAGVESDEICKQPSREVNDSEFLACNIKDVPIEILKHSKSAFWGISYSQQHDEYFSSRIARRDDCEISLITDFYQRAFEADANTANLAEHNGSKIVDIINSRHLADIELILALSAGQDIYVITPTNGEPEYYKPQTTEVLSNLIWNNLIRYYTNNGIGYIDDPMTNEERMATSMIGYGHDSSLILAFSSGSIVLQIHKGTGFFLHSQEEHEIKKTAEAAPKNIEFELA